MLLLQNDCDMKTSELKSCYERSKSWERADYENTKVKLRGNIKLQVQFMISSVQGDIPISVIVTIFTIYKCLKSNIGHIEPLTNIKVWKKTNSKFKQIWKNS